MESAAGLEDLDHWQLHLARKRLCSYFSCSFLCNSVSFGVYVLRCVSTV